jgi:hypothetical protein
MTAYYRKLIQNCRHCGQTFELTRYGGRGAVYCSNACKQSAYRRRRIRNALARRKGNDVPKVET